MSPLPSTSDMEDGFDDDDTAFADVSSSECTCVNGNVCSLHEATFAQEETTPEPMVLAGGHRLTLSVNNSLPRLTGGLVRRRAVSTELTQCSEAPIGSLLLRQSLCAASKLTSSM